MASKEAMLALLGSSRWRAPALALMAALIFSACAAAQDNDIAISAEQTLTQVRALHAAGRFAESIGPLETYLASDARNTVVRLEYARTLAILRRFPEAAREYRRVLDTEPQNAAALIGVAKVASWQGQNQLAVETYDRVLARGPALYDALVGKGFVLLWMGRQEEARALFREAQRQYPNDPEVREALASLGSPALSPVQGGAGGEVAKLPARETPKPAPAEVPKPGTAAGTVITPSSDVPEPTSVAPATTTEKPVRPAPVVEPPPKAVPAATSQRKSVPFQAKGTSERPAAATVAIRQEPMSPRNGSPSPMRISLASALQVAMLGMVVVVAGAIAYRTYRVRLSSAPLPERRVFELPPSSLIPPPRPAPATRAGKEGPLAGRVLVVHPQEAVRDFARKVLAGAGAEVLALGRGEDAVVRLEKSAYDAMVVSDQLPAGWSGRELYRWLERNQPGAERRFVLALTDDTDAEMQSFLEESRALAISAPFGVSDLLAMTRLAMGRSRIQA